MKLKHDLYYFHAKIEKRYRIVLGWIALLEEELYLQWNNAVRNKLLTKNRTIEIGESMYIINGIVYADSEAVCVTVKDAKALDGMIMITFSNREKRLFDATVLKEEVFEPLKNNDIFKDFKVEFGTITREDNEIDIAPEYLYKNSYQYNYPE